MVSSRTFVCPEQTPHPSSGTSSSRPENWHPIGLDSGSPYHLYLGESAHPVLHWSLHNSLKNSTDEPDETEGNAFSLTCVNQFGGNSPLTHQPPSDAGNFCGCQGNLQWRTLGTTRQRVQQDSMPLQSSSWDRVWCGGVEAISCSVQPEGGIERYVTQALIFVFMATLIWHNAGYQHSYPISTESMGTFCNHLEVLGWFQQL